MWIYLTRHAETDGNINRIVQTPTTALSIKGKHQADQFADAYSEAQITSILSSDYDRTRDTAQALQTKLNCPLVFDELLRERNFGKLRGQSYSDITSEVFEHHYHPPGGESYSDFVTRIKTAWLNVNKVAKAQPGNLLVMTHGLVVRCILTEILHLPKDVLEKTDIQNTSVTKIKVSDQTIIPLLCDTSHLHCDALQNRE